MAKKTAGFVKERNGSARVFKKAGKANKRVINGKKANTLGNSTANSGAKHKGSTIPRRIIIPERLTRSCIALATIKYQGSYAIFWSGLDVLVCAKLLLQSGGYAHA
jgi:hypothetical protein